MVTASERGPAYRVFTNALTFTTLGITLHYRTDAHFSRTVSAAVSASITARQILQNTGKMSELFC